MSLSHRLVALATVAFLAGSRRASAQNAPLTRIDLALAGTPEAPTLVGTDLNGGANAFNAGKGLQVVVACAEPFDCRKLTSTTDQAVSSNASANTVLFVVPSTAEGTKITLPLVYDGHAVLPSLSLVSTVGGSAATKTTPPPRPPLAVRVRDKGCANSIMVADPNAYVLWADGTPIAAPITSPVEGMAIRFYVLGEQSVLSHLSVKRKSALRIVTISNVAGGGTPLPPKTDFNPQGRQLITCGVDTTTIGDFASGDAQIEISALDDDGTTHVENTFDFNVHALYTGAYALAAISTNVANPSFGKAFNGTDTVVTATDDGRHRVLYAMTYTPFVWGRRDITRPTARWWEALNPMVGVVLNDIPNNAIIGVSYDVGNLLYATGGLHAARVSTLDQTAGAVLGQPYENRAATVPTVKRWEYGWFGGASIDLQGAVGLLKAALGATASKGGN